MSRYERVLFRRIQSTSIPICSCFLSTYHSHPNTRRVSWPASTSHTTLQSEFVCTNRTACSRKSETGLFSSYSTLCASLTPAATATSSLRTYSLRPSTTCFCVIWCRVSPPAYLTRSKSIISGSAIWIIIKDAIRHQSDGTNPKRRSASQWTCLVLRAVCMRSWLASAYSTCLDSKSIRRVTINLIWERS